MNGGRLTPPSARQVWRIAWPIILANSAVPLLGIVDTAVIGRTGETLDLGAIALGALIFNFIYWGFGFLRMGTTGFVAQADGAAEEAEIRATLGRALILAALIAAGLLLLQVPIAWLATELLGASEGVESLTRSYLLVRLWGAPATLALFAMMGLFVGLGRSGQLLRVQLFLNGLNIVLDVLFAGVMGWGVTGIAVGTVIAEWAALCYAAFLTRRLLQDRRADPEPFWPRDRILNTQKLRHTLQANADIMIRTLLMLFGFAWFADQGARFGDVVLASNHVLLQFVGFSAFFLDGFAFAAESLVGRAAGARQRAVLDHAVKASTILAGGTAVCLALLLFLFGPLAIEALTDLPDVRETAQQYLPFAAIYVLLSFPAFQLDGIFIGATRTRDMRNASFVSLVVFLAAWWPLAQWAGNTGLWLAMIIYVMTRAATLAQRYPGLRASVAPTPEPTA